MHATMRTAPARTQRLSRRSAASLAVLAPLMLAGCSFSVSDKTADGDDKESGAPTSDASQGETGGEGEPGASDETSGGGASDGGGANGDSGDGAVVDEDAKAAGVDPATLGEPVFSVDVPAVLTDDGLSANSSSTIIDRDASMTVSLYGLEQHGQTVTATYSFLVHSDAADAVPEMLYHYLGGNSWDPFAVDTTNLNRHDVLSGETGAGPTKTDDRGMTFSPGQTFYAFATFAAPPADVTTMDVMLVNGAPMARGVEITR